MDDDIGDELSSLIVTACHHVLTCDARGALALRLIGGLTTDEIARAFLASEPTIAQRIVKARKAHHEAGIAFEVPCGVARQECLSAGSDLSDLQRGLRRYHGRKSHPPESWYRGSAPGAYTCQPYAV